jgi:hypothetical protein
MFPLFKTLNHQLIAPPGVSAIRLPTFYPSAASSRNLEASDIDDPQTLGGCIRSEWYRCKGHQQTDPPGIYSQYIFAAGNMWESWLTEKFKQMGVWVGNNIKWALPERYISGEVDIIIKNPETGEKIIVESKTWGSTNYQAKKELCGSRFGTPTPKVQNLMQSFIYLDVFKEQGITKTVLTYLDRACGGPDNNVEFWIERVPNGDSYSAKVTSLNHFGDTNVFVDKRFTIGSIYQRYDELMEFLRQDVTPPRDYENAYSKEKIERLHAADKIAKTRYEAFQKKGTPIGDWQCSYCSYKTLCYE